MAAGTLAVLGARGLGNIASRAAAYAAGSTLAREGAYAMTNALKRAWRWVPSLRWGKEWPRGYYKKRYQRGFAYYGKPMRSQYGSKRYGFKRRSSFRRRQYRPFRRYSRGMKRAYYGHMAGY